MPLGTFTLCSHNTTVGVLEEERSTGMLAVHVDTNLYIRERLIDDLEYHQLQAGIAVVLRADFAAA